MHVGEILPVFHVSTPAKRKVVLLYIEIAESDSI